MINISHLNGEPLFWTEKVKYLGTYIQCNTGITDLRCNTRKFYSQFNNVLSLLGKYAHKMSTLHLMKTYCLPALLYGVETWSLNNTSRHPVSVAWNNSFRHISHSCWHDSVKTLQYFCQLLPMSYLTDQRQLLFWQKMMTSDISLTSCTRMTQPSLLIHLPGHPPVSVVSARPRQCSVCVFHGQRLQLFKTSALDHSHRLF